MKAIPQSQQLPSWEVLITLLAYFLSSMVFLPKRELASLLLTKIFLPKDDLQPKLLFRFGRLGESLDLKDESWEQSLSFLYEDFPEGSESFGESREP